MIDLQALALMLGGTLLATALQAGFGSFRIGVVALFGLLKKPFDQAQTRAQLSRQILDLDRDGLVRAPRAAILDAEFGQATGAMISNRSLDALIAHHEGARSLRFANANTARATWMQAAEVVQMFGLAGTLLSLGRLGPLADGAEGVASAIGLAVITTLYGIILANLVFVPLAGLIERRARAEDQEREELFLWLESHAQRAAPRQQRPGPRAVA